MNREAEPRRTVGARSRYSGALLTVAGVSVALLAGGILMAKPRRRRRGLGFMHIRDAGPENMEFAPSEWDRVDEAVDESFPASDPPFHCIRSRYN